MADKNEDEELEGPEPEAEEDIYEEEKTEELKDDDEISPEEEGFMEGYEEEESVAECAKCKKPLLEVEGAVEREHNGRHYRFCSEKCADAFKFGK